MLAVYITHFRVNSKMSCKFPIVSILFPFFRHVPSVFLCHHRLYGIEITYILTHTNHSMFLHDTVKSLLDVPKKNASILQFSKNDFPKCIHCIYWEGFRKKITRLCDIKQKQNSTMLHEICCRCHIKCSETLSISMPIDIIFHPHQPFATFVLHSISHVPKKTGSDNWINHSNADSVCFIHPIICR